MPHLNRAVDDPLIPSSGYRAYALQNPVVSKIDPEKTLDLDKLHFTLDDFQKLSKGTYNAGEFRITDSGKLDIVTEILKQVKGWEEKLAECSTEGNPTQLADINDDLRQFLVDNLTTIQRLIDKARADKA